MYHTKNPKETIPTGDVEVEVEAVTEASDWKKDIKLSTMSPNAAKTV